MVEEVDEEGLSTSRYLGDIRIHHLTRGSIQTTMIGEAFSVVAKAILDAIPRFEVLQMMMMKAVWSSLQKRKRKLNFHNNLLLPLPRGPSKRPCRSSASALQKRSKTEFVPKQHLILSGNCAMKFPMGKLFCRATTALNFLCILN